MQVARPDPRKTGPDPRKGRPPENIWIDRLNAIIHAVNVNGSIG